MTSKGDTSVRLALSMTRKSRALDGLKRRRGRAKGKADEKSEDGWKSYRKAFHIFPRHRVCHGNSVYVSVTHEFDYYIGFLFHEPKYMSMGMDAEFNDIYKIIAINFKHQ